MLKLCHNPVSKWPPKTSWDQIIIFMVYNKKMQQTWNRGIISELPKHNRVVKKLNQIMSYFRRISWITWQMIYRMEYGHCKWAIVEQMWAAVIYHGLGTMLFINLKPTYLVVSTLGMELRMLIWPLCFDLHIISMYI